MGVFSRISNMVKGKTNAILDDMENPIELLDQKVRDMEKNLSQAKMNSASVLGNVSQIEKKIQAAKSESADWEAKVKLAMSKGNEDLAKKALAKKLECDKKIESLTTSYNASKAQAEALKKTLASLEEELIKTRSYRDEAAARYSTAQASSKVNEIMADIQTKNNSISMDSIERKIQKTESQAAGLAELSNVGSLESEFDSLNAIDLDSELEKYR